MLILSMNWIPQKMKMIIKKIMNENFEYLESYESKAWIKVDLTEQYNGIELFENSDSDNGIIELLSKSQIDGVTPDEMLKMKMLDFEERKKMEKDLLNLKLIEKINDNTQVVLVHMSAPTPVSSREFVSTRGNKKKEDGTTKCHIYHNDQFVEEITLENFLREWRRLKRKQKPAINLQPPPVTQVIS